MVLPLQRQLTAEFQRRAQVLPQEVQEWADLAQANVGGMGIHRSQIEAVGDIFADLSEAQAEALAALDPTLPEEEFAEARLALELALTGTHSIMATFRYVLGQILTPALQPVAGVPAPAAPRGFRAELDLAHLIAADCYLPCIRRANRWRDLPATNLREPPLILLNAMLSPTAIARGYGFRLLGLTLYEERERPLPVPVISLPVHATTALWTYCSLYHETAHLLDQDLAFRRQLREPLQQRLGQSQQLADWDRWLGEMIGDVFGVLLGGAGFAYALRSLLFTTDDEATRRQVDEHPAGYIRIFLVGALLRATGVADLATVANTIEGTWRNRYGEPSDWDAYRQECAAVAAFLLDTPLPDLANHPLRDFAFDTFPDGGPDLAADHQLATTLGRFLRRGKNPPVSVAPYRLLPAAAQLAVEGLSEADDFLQCCGKIHERALAYATDAIKRPPFMAPPPQASTKRREYQRSLTRNFLSRQDP